MALDDFCLGGFHFRHTGQHHNGHVVEARVEPHLFEYLEARSIIGEAKVQNHGIDVGGIQPNERGIRIAGLQHIAPRAREELFEYATRRQRVLDDEDRAAQPWFDEKCHCSLRESFVPLHTALWRGPITLAARGAGVV